MEIPGNCAASGKLGLEKGLPPRIRNTKTKRAPDHDSSAQKPNPKSARREQTKLTDMLTPKGTLASSRAPKPNFNHLQNRNKNKPPVFSQPSIPKRFQPENAIGIRGGEENQGMRNTPAVAKHKSSQPNAREHYSTSQTQSTNSTISPKNYSTESHRASYCSPSASTGASWKALKQQYGRTQRRAFVRKADNPFSMYSHDPNSSETLLEELSNQSEITRCNNSNLHEHESQPITGYREAMCIGSERAPGSTISNEVYHEQPYVTTDHLSAVQTIQPAPGFPQNSYMHPTTAYVPQQQILPAAQANNFIGQAAALYPRFSTSSSLSCVPNIPLLPNMRLPANSIRDQAATPYFHRHGSRHCNDFEANVTRPFLNTTHNTTATVFHGAIPQHQWVPQQEMVYDSVNPGSHGSLENAFAWD